LTLKRQIYTADS